MSPTPISLTQVGSIQYGSGSTIITGPHPESDAIFVLFYVLIVAGRKHIAQFVDEHIFGHAHETHSTGERAPLLSSASGGHDSEESVRKVLFPGVVAGGVSLLVSAFLLWDGLIYHQWITHYLTWWLTYMTLVVASAIIFARTLSFSKAFAASRTTFPDLGLTAQHTGVVIALLPLAALATRYSYYNRWYGLSFVDTYFLSFVLLPILGVGITYWGSGLVRVATSPSAVSVASPEVPATTV